RRSRAVRLFLGRLVFDLAIAIVYSHPVVGLFLAVREQLVDDSLLRLRRWPGKILDDDVNPNVLSVVLGPQLADLVIRLDNRIAGHAGAAIHDLAGLAIGNPKDTEAIAHEVLPSNVKRQMSNVKCQMSKVKGQMSNV